MRINVNKDILRSHFNVNKKITFIQKNKIFVSRNQRAMCLFAIFHRLTFIFKGLINNQGVFKYTIYSITMLLKILSLLENSK